METLNTGCLQPITVRSEENSNKPRQLLPRLPIMWSAKEDINTASPLPETGETLETDKTIRSDEIQQPHIPLGTDLAQTDNVTLADCHEAKDEQKPFQTSTTDIPNCVHDMQLHPEPQATGVVAVDALMATTVTGPGDFVSCAAQYASIAKSDDLNEYDPDLQESEDRGTSAFPPSPDSRLFDDNSPGTLNSTDFDQRKSNVTTTPSSRVKVKWTPDTEELVWSMYCYNTSCEVIASRIQGATRTAIYERLKRIKRRKLASIGNAAASHPSALSPNASITPLSAKAVNNCVLEPSVNSGPMGASANVANSLEPTLGAADLSPHQLAQEQISVDSVDVSCPPRKKPKASFIDKRGHVRWTQETEELIWALYLRNVAYPQIAMQIEGATVSSIVEKIKKIKKRKICDGVPLSSVSRSRRGANYMNALTKRQNEEFLNDPTDANLLHRKNPSGQNAYSHFKRPLKVVRGTNGYVKEVWIHDTIDGVQRTVYKMCHRNTWNTQFKRPHSSKLITKCFNIMKYGNELAWNMAVNLRPDDLGKDSMSSCYVPASNGETTGYSTGSMTRGSVNSLEAGGAEFVPFLNFNDHSNRLDMYDNGSFVASMASDPHGNENLSAFDNLHGSLGQRPGQYMQTDTMGQGESLAGSCGNMAGTDDGQLPTISNYDAQMYRCSESERMKAENAGQVPGMLQDSRHSIMNGMIDPKMHHHGGHQGDHENDSHGNGLSTYYDSHHHARIIPGMAGSTYETDLPTDHSPAAMPTRMLGSPSSMYDALFKNVRDRRDLETMFGDEGLQRLLSVLFPLSYDKTSRINTHPASVGINVSSLKNDERFIEDQILVNRFLLAFEKIRAASMSCPPENVVKGSADQERLTTESTTISASSSISSIAEDDRSWSRESQFSAVESPSTAATGHLASDPASTLVKESNNYNSSEVDPVAVPPAEVVSSGSPSASTEDEVQLYQTSNNEKTTNPMMQSAWPDVNDSDVCPKTDELTFQMTETENKNISSQPYTTTRTENEEDILFTSPPTHLITSDHNGIDSWCTDNQESTNTPSLLPTTNATDELEKVKMANHQSKITAKAVTTETSSHVQPFQRLSNGFRYPTEEELFKVLGCLLTS